MIITPDLLISNAFSLVPNSTACYEKDGFRVCFYSWQHMIASIGMDHYLKGEKLTVQDIELFYTDKTGKDLCILIHSN